MTDHRKRDPKGRILPLTTGSRSMKELETLKARNQVLTEALMGLAEMVRTEVSLPHGRLRESNAFKQALVVADEVLAAGKLS